MTKSATGLRTVLSLMILSCLPVEARAGSRGAYIVEFRTEAAPGITSPGEPTETHARFRDDLATIEPGRPDAGSPGARIDREYWRLFHGAAIRIEEQGTIARILALPYVSNIHLDALVSSDGFAAEAGVRPAASHPAPTSGGRGIVVAVIDSGVDYNHPALGGGIGPGRRVIGGYDFINDDADPMDDNRHGTHVAGIIAARSAELTGIAPEVSLLAYKVLNASGQGPLSATIAALERAIDPNGDGDFSDRADVINLSLGTAGYADDPVAKAADRASALGAVVVAAVGNSGEEHAIASPALARTVIGVGAVDGGGRVAEFSARGPAAGTAAVKPDILAPGVLIRSTAIGGGALTLSGTSMAAPYISGIAARILEQHPTWSPERVRASIVASGYPVPDAPVMAQGAGRIDVPTALSSRLFIDATSLGFGAIDRTVETFVATRSIRLRNEQEVPVTVTAVIPDLPDGVRIIIPSPVLELPPGEDRELIVSLEVDTAVIDAGENPPFAVGGWLQIGSAPVYVPWSFVRAARVFTSYDRPFPQMVWSSSRLARGSFRPLDPYTFEALLEPGRYDLAVLGQSEGEVQVIIREDLDLDGDLDLPITSAEAGFEIRPEASDPSGGALNRITTGTHLYTLTGRLLHSAQDRRWSLELPEDFTSLRTSDFGSRWSLLLSETAVDISHGRMVVAQHPPVTDPEAQSVLRMLPGDYAEQHLAVHFPGDVAERNVWLLPRGVTRRIVEVGRRPEGIGIGNVPAEWAGTIWMSPEVHDDYASGVQIGLYTGDPVMQGTSAVVTPTIRRQQSGFISTRSMEPAPVPTETSSGDSLEWGAGTIWPSIAVDVIDVSPGKYTWSGAVTLLGDRNEIRRRETAKSAWRLLTSGGTVVTGGVLGLGSFFTEPSSSRRMEVLVASPETGNFESSTGRLDIVMSVTGDAEPPTLTSFGVMDHQGTVTRHLTTARSGKLVFSAADPKRTLEEALYQPIDEHATRAWARWPGNSGWTPLELRLTGEDAGRESDIGRPAAGFIYEADLEDAGVAGYASLRIEIRDRTGNLTTWTLEPAIRVQGFPAPRRRGVRRPN